MKKFLSIFLVLTVFLGIAIAAELQPIPFPFVGRWQPAEDPTLLDDYGLQDIQNVRKVGKHFKGIGGHTVINTTSTATWPNIINGFHFRKDQPSESHVIILASDSALSASVLYDNTTAVPSAGAFSGTVLHTDLSGGYGKGRFSTAPAGNMVYSNQVETLIWAGNEGEPVAFISATDSTADSNLTNPIDLTEEARNAQSRTTNLITAGGSTNYWFIGYYRPLQGIKLYIQTANSSTSTITAKEWTGRAWGSLSVTDNSSQGGVSLYKTGTITWPSTAATSAPKHINGLSLYWYQFYISAGVGKIYYATVDAPMQTIKNIWNGVEVIPSKCLKWNGTNYTDYSDYVIDESVSTYADISSLQSTHYVVAGFSSPQQALVFTMVPGSENTTAAELMTLYYWSGTAWVEVFGQTDGTITSSRSFTKTGTVSFQGLGQGTEFKKAISDEVPLYYYKIGVSGTLDSDTKIAEIRGIPNPPTMSTYTFSHEFQNRLFLFNDRAGDKNKAVYSIANAPDIFNGDDSGNLYFGDKTDVVAAAFVYNVFRAGAYDQLIVAKKNEVYRLSGDGPANWTIQRISSNIGCVAPLSMVACEVSEGSETDTKKQVAIWQGDRGFYLTDGAAVIPISDDIKCYFDPNDSRYIPTARQSKSVGWYDPLTRSYKALVSSGSSATVYHNLELEYSLVSKEWTKIYRENSSGADPLQSGWQVWDTNGIGYTYGGNTTGYMYRLENGATFAGQNIVQKIHTKDLILDAQAPLFRKSTAKFMRVAHKKKAGGGTVAITHYGDQYLTVNGSSNQVVPSAIDLTAAPYNSSSINLGPALYHSFLFTSTQSTADGLELTGMGIYSEPQTIWR